MLFIIFFSPRKKKKRKKKENGITNQKKKEKYCSRLKQNMLKYQILSSDQIWKQKYWQKLCYLYLYFKVYISSFIENDKINSLLKGNRWSHLIITNYISYSDLPTLKLQWFSYQGILAQYGSLPEDVEGFLVTVHQSSVCQ